MDRHYINDPKKTDDQLTSARDAWLNKYVKRYKPEPFKYKEPIKTSEAPQNLPGVTVGNLLGQTTTNASTPGYTPVNVLQPNIPPVTTASRPTNNRFFFASAESIKPPLSNTAQYTAAPFRSRGNEYVRLETLDPQQTNTQPFSSDSQDVTIETVPYEEQIRKDNDEMTSNMLESETVLKNMQNDIDKLDSIYEKYMDGVRVHEKSIAGEDITPELKYFQQKYGSTDTQGAIRESEAEFKRINDTVAFFNNTMNVTGDYVNYGLEKTTDSLTSTFNYLAPKFAAASTAVYDYIITPGTRAATDAAAAFAEYADQKSSEYGAEASNLGAYAAQEASSATKATYLRMMDYGNRLYNSIAEQIKNIDISGNPERAAERINSDLAKFNKVTSFIEATKIAADEELKNNDEDVVEKMELQQAYPSTSKGVESTTAVDFSNRLFREELANKESGVAEINQRLEQLKTDIRTMKKELQKFVGPNDVESLDEKFETVIMMAFRAFSNDRDFITGQRSLEGPNNISNIDNMNFPVALPGQDNKIYMENVSKFTRLISFVNQFVQALSGAISTGGEGVYKTLNTVLDSALQFVALFNPSVVGDTYARTGTVYSETNPVRGAGIKKYNQEIAGLKTGYGIKGIPLIKAKMREMMGGLVNDLKPKYKNYEPIHKIIDHVSTLPKFKRGGLVRKESYGCGMCKSKPGYGKRFLVHNKNNKDITCSNCFGDHAMTGGRITERDAEFNFIEDSKDPEHEEMVANQKTNDYLDEIEKESPKTAFEDFDTSANIDKRFINRMGSDFVVNRPYDMRKNFESKDLDRLAYLVGMHEHAPEQMTTPLKVNLEALAINHLTKHNDPKATFPNPSKLQNFDSTKQELQNNPGFLKRFLQ